MEFADRHGLAMLRGVTKTGFFGNEMCLMGDETVLIHIHVDRGSPYAWLAPTVRPNYWIGFYDVIQDQENAFSRDLGRVATLIEELGERLTYVRAMFQPAAFQEFATRVEKRRRSRTTEGITERDKELIRKAMAGMNRSEPIDPEKPEDS